MNQLHLGKAFFGNFDLTTNEKNRLDSIANQCPTLGGDAVFGARSILSAAGWWEYYDDDSLCQVSALRPTVQTTLHTSKSDLLIYPNPTSERISVQIAKGWTGKADINITDALGNSVMHKSFDLMPTVSGSIEIIVAGLPPGLFVIHVYIDDKIAGSKKFIKIK